MPPPPIDWRTKPQPNQQRQDGRGSQSSSVGTLQQPGAATDAALIPVYLTPARISQIEAALRFLGLPPLSHPDIEDLVEYHQAANAPGGRFIRISPSRLSSSEFTTSSPQLSSPDLTTSSSQLSLSDLMTSSPRLSTPDLTASFSRLSMSTNSVQIPTASFPVRRTPATRSDPSPRKGLKKYYVVTIGKCTGIFWEEWDKVTPFINGVSGARYKGFATHEQAAQFYLNAKENSLVRVVRDPGDEKFFGPLRDAMQ